MTINDNLEIVDANKVDLEVLYEALREIYNSSSAFSEMFATKYPATTDLAEDIASTIENGQFFVVQSNKIILGFLKLSPQQDTFLQHTAFFSMGVKSESQGKGIGKLLMSTMLENRNTSTEIIYLMVRGNNLRAIGLYEKFRFNKIATLPKDTKVNGEYIDGILMSRSFI